jgi:hypothetical protein
MITLNIEELGMELSTMISGARILYDLLELPRQKFLGIDFDGMLLIDYRAVEPSLEPGPIFIIREGEFALGGERQSRLREVLFTLLMSRCLLVELLSPQTFWEGKKIWWRCL